MLPPKTHRHRVALLGFSEFERRTLGSCFRLAGERKTAYVLTSRVDTANYLVADADHTPSVEVVRVTERLEACVFIGARPPDGAMIWIQRPIDPVRVMRELDALVAMAGDRAAVGAVQPAPPRAGARAEAEAGTPAQAVAHFDADANAAATAEPLRGSAGKPAEAESPLDLRPLAASARATAAVDLEAETTPAAFNVAPHAGSQPAVEVAPPHLLRAEWQPETQPGWEPEWPPGWHGVNRDGSPVFVPADEPLLAPTVSPPPPPPPPPPLPPLPPPPAGADVPSENPSAAPLARRSRAPMQAWVDAPPQLRRATLQALSPSPRQPSSPVPPAGPSLALVVDDSPVAARFLQRRLEAHGVQVTCADNSGDAIALFEAHAFDLIFLDVELGPSSALDGLALCQRIRQSAASVDTRVVLVSAHHSEVDRARGQLAGCDAYLGKPLKAPELSQLLSRHGLRAA